MDSGEQSLPFGLLVFTSGDWNGDFWSLLVFILIQRSTEYFFLSGAKVLLHSDPDVVFEQSMVFYSLFCCGGVYSVESRVVSVTELFGGQEDAPFCFSF